MTFLTLFLTFFKIGLFTFGGGYAMIPLIQSEVIGNGWLKAGELIDFIAVSESTPGPFAINIATFVGESRGGVFGALCATLGVVLPSFIIILIVAKCFNKFKQSTAVRGIMTGLKPAVVGLIGSAVVSIGSTVLFPNGITTSAFLTPAFLCSALIFLIGAALEFLPKKKLHPILIIAISAVLGIAAGYIFNF